MAMSISESLITPNALHSQCSSCPVLGKTMR